MPRKTKNSLELDRLAKRAQRNGRQALLDDICEGMYEKYLRNNNRLPYGHLEGILKALVAKEEWLSRNILNKAFMKYRKKIGLKKAAPTADRTAATVTISSSKSTAARSFVPDTIERCSTPSFESDLTPGESESSTRPGRPSGTTVVKQRKKLKKLAIYDI